MTFEFNTVDRPKLYMAIVSQILEGIRSEAFPPGAALPTERRLAERFGVSRTSLREAIRILEHAGIVDVRTGSGSYVSETALSSPTLMRVKAAVEGDVSPLDVIVARKVLEAGCAEQAALNRKDADLVRLRQAFAAHQDLVTQGGDPREMDISFHQAVAEATGNPALAGLMQYIAAIMRQNTWQSFSDRSRRKPGRPEKNVHDHQSILEAIEHGDGQGARKAVLQHLADVESMTLVVAQEPAPRDEIPAGKTN
jgi:GntR family transcriptional regulator, transcriptional repressor for pyruvate dehydrogenase complex